MKVFANNFVGLRRGVRNPAGQLFHVERPSVQSKYVIGRRVWIGKKAKPGRRDLSELLFALPKINGKAANPAGRSCLKSAYSQSEPEQGST